MPKTLQLPSFILFLLLSSGCAPSDPGAPLHSLFEREWSFRLQEDPLLATSVGVHRYNDRLPSMGLRDLQRRQERARGFLDELGRIDRESLGSRDQVSYAIFEKQLTSRIRSFEFRDFQLPINADSGFHTSIARLPQQVPLQTLRDYENYLARLAEIPRYFEEFTTLMRLGIQEGRTLPAVVTDGIDAAISSHVVDDPRLSVFFEPFESFPEAISSTDRDRLQREGAAAIRESVVPAYRSFAEFITGEYIPACRQTLGASELPEGPDYYQWLIGEHTTLELSADEIHQIGLEEVERIRTEMEAIVSEVGFEGEFRQFLDHLRTNPEFFPETSEELLMRAAWIAKEMDGKLPALFKTLPRLPYTVEAVPDHLAPKYTTGRYVSAPFGGTRPGIYWVNTYNLPSRTLYTLPALTLHEAVPGHHLQYALLHELDDLPDFRRFSSVTAFGEGWGLYAEFLGIEAGIYKTPYEHFGRLTYEMWRACRLVVDTGIHMQGWTRSQAIDYLASNTALSLHECTTETDRYISWPGQALAYKIGELKIRELRKKAEEALGPNFDVRQFHDAVLLNGPVPLSLLEDLIDSFIRDQLGS
jgi:uncharacterized protein (DUF885 family)